MRAKPQSRANTSPPTKVSQFDRLKACRQLSRKLTQPLSDEDQVVQAMDDASPTKWHLAHTTWFFESFILRDLLPGYQPFSDAFEFCFNSYYEAKGDRHPRAHRGLLTRPSAGEVRDYRSHVDEALEKLMAHAKHDEETSRTIATLIELGINHEQQHQELLLTDILALFASQPLKPAYQTIKKPEDASFCDPSDLEWIPYRGGVCKIGHSKRSFSYDNEGPCHHMLVHPFKLANRCVTNGEWLAFMQDGGYKNPLLWLADGWKTIQELRWTSPEYWEEDKDGAWHQMTLMGLLAVDPSAPVSHVSYYEADAFARWSQKRLPTEFEWEIATEGLDVAGNTLGSGHLRPLKASPQTEDHPSQMFGDVWEWTQSAYQHYPGYKPAKGAVGEYNGKFMCSQQVLRGASCVTPDGHIRPTYRNFFYPYQRWQFCGLRLAKDHT